MKALVAFEAQFEKEGGMFYSITDSITYCYPDEVDKLYKKLFPIKEIVIQMRHIDNETAFVRMWFESPLPYADKFKAKLNEQSIHIKKIETTRGIENARFYEGDLTVNELINITEGAVHGGT